MTPLTPAEVTSQAITLLASAPGSASGLFDRARLSAPMINIPPLTQPNPSPILPVLSQSAQPALPGINPNLSTYVVLSEWAAPALARRGVALPTEFWVAHLVSMYDRDTMLAAIAALGRAIQARKVPELVRSIQASLLPDVLHELDRVLRGDLHPQVVCRQGLLLAAKLVMRAGAPGTSDPDDLPPLLAATLLSQVALEDVGSRPTPSGTDLFPSMDAALGADVAASWLFYTTAEAVSTMDQTRRLWTEHLPRGDAAMDRSPAELFRDATGLDIVEFTKLGLMIWAATNGLENFEVPTLASWDHFPFAAEFRAQALRFIAETPEALVKVLDAEDRGAWDVRAFETAPVVLLAEGPPLVLDEILLWRRFADGPYWAVFDNLKARGDDSHLAWTRAYGDMVQQAAQATLLHMALPVLPTGRTYWDDSVVAEAFGRVSKRTTRKTADGVLIIEAEAVAIEIFSGGPTVASRIAADADAFIKDMEKLLWDKVLQLDSTAAELLEDDRRLTRWPNQATRVVRPLLVQWRTFPMMPVVHAYIEAECRARDLLQQEGVKSLLVVELDELEMLFAVCQDTHRTLTRLLDEWAVGQHRGFTVKNHLIDVFSDLDARLRPAAVTERIVAAFDELEARARRNLFS